MQHGVLSEKLHELAISGVSPQTTSEPPCPTEKGPKRSRSFACFETSYKVASGEINLSPGLSLAKHPQLPVVSLVAC